MKNCDHSDKLPKNMTAIEAEQLFGYMISGKLNDDEIAEILLALKEKGETAEEIIGAIRAIKKQAVLINLPYETMDVCGTGGDNLNTLNVSTATSFILAACGIKVAKHGNKAVSSKSGSSDVIFSIIGIEGIHKNPEKYLEKANFCYLHAPEYHPVLKKVAPARAKVGRSIFNLLGPLLNPTSPKFQLIGVYDKKYLRIFAEVLRQQGTKKAWIAHGLEDGMDEISISGPTQVCELDKGAIDTFIITPEDAGLPRHPLESIKGGDAKHNAAALLRLLDGEKGAYRDIVLLNSAAALLVAGKAETLEQGVQLAAASIDSGKAKEIVERLSGK